MFKVAVRTEVQRLQARLGNATCLSPSPIRGGDKLSAVRRRPLLIWIAHAVEKRAAGLSIDTVEGLSEDFNCLPDLITELIGNFLLVLAALSEQSRKLIGISHTDQPA